MKKLLFLLSLSFTALFATVDTNKPLPTIVLEEDNGGYYSGDAWNSEMFKGKTTLLMYVDPDEKNKGEVFKPTIEAFEKELDFDTFQIVVIINLGATWKPNALIRTMMKSKITDYPKRTYVLDVHSTLVKGWDLPDDEYNTLVLNKEGKVVYQHAGSWDQQQIKKADAVVRSLVKE